MQHIRHPPHFSHEGHVMEEFFKRLKTIQAPSQTKPWLELEYTDYSNFLHFVQFINGLDNPARLRQQDQPFFFRGQSDAQHTLKPKLVRLLDGVPLREALGYEFDSVCYFRERAHLFCAAPFTEICRKRVRELKIPSQCLHQRWGPAM
jgi:hypothetical protein